MSIPDRFWKPVAEAYAVMLLRKIAFFETDPPALLCQSPRSRYTLCSYMVACGSIQYALCVPLCGPEVSILVASVFESDNVEVRSFPVANKIAMLLAATLCVVHDPGRQDTSSTNSYQCTVWRPTLGGKNPSPGNHSGRSVSDRDWGACDQIFVPSTHVKQVFFNRKVLPIISVYSQTARSS